MNRPRFFVPGAALLGGLLLAPAALAVPIDLNDFTADPTVTVAPDGSSAVLMEDPGASVVLLVNDPFFGDPQVIVPGPGVSLLFEFNFIEAGGHNDAFSVFVIDAATGLSAGAAFEFTALDTAAGTLAFNLSPLAGQSLGLQFQLASLLADPGVGSAVTVSNLRLETATVPAPAPGLLLAAGLVGGIALRRR